MDDEYIVVDDGAYASRVAEALATLGVSCPLRPAGETAGRRRLALVVCEVDDEETSHLAIVQTLTQLNARPTFVFTSRYLAAGPGTPDARSEATRDGGPPEPAPRGNAPTAAPEPAAAQEHAGSVDLLRFLRPQTVGDRWATYVWRACCASTGDLKTLARWAKCVGVSYSSLCETCRLLDIPPHDARDFMRVLCAIVLAARTGCRADVLLDVSDRRTLHRIFERGGVNLGRQAPSAVEFLSQQRFIPLPNPGVVALGTLIANIGPGLCGFTNCAPAECPSP